MIDESDISRLKEIFVTRQECNTDMAKMDARIESENVRLAVIETQLRLILWILAAVGTGIITMLVKMFWG